MIARLRRIVVSLICLVCIVITYDNEYKVLLGWLLCALMDHLMLMIPAVRRAVIDRLRKEDQS